MVFEFSEKRKGHESPNGALSAADVLIGASRWDVGKRGAQVAGYPMPKLDIIGEGKDNAQAQRQQIAAEYIQLSPTVGVWKHTVKEDGFRSDVFVGTDGKCIGYTINGKGFPRA